MKRSGNIVLFLLLFLTACQYTIDPAVHSSIISTTTSPLASTTECSDTFITHTLDHVTTTSDGVVRMFEANGAGVAVGDLDGDHDLDIVLGNYAGMNTILWNEGISTSGRPQFRTERFAEGYTRAITLVDVDHDEWLDIVLTRSTGALNYWSNLGDGTYARDVLPGVSKLASVLNWGDLDQDGDLDLVTATYDAGLLTDLGNTFLLDGNGGVFYYENQSGENQESRFVPTTLAAEAQAMAVAFFDVDRDGAPEILIGNDFAVPDYAWTRVAGEWTPIQPFARTSHSTMSLDWGDIDNDGGLELFSADMKPYAHDDATLAAWEPIMAGMAGEHPPDAAPHGGTQHDDPQHMANMLQTSDGIDSIAEVAQERGVDGTGWSWSSKFGDLDNDGYLDLYVVNGMIEERMFAHLPKHELVEENQAFRNDGAGHFLPMPTWNLNSTLSGRSMVMADFDLDGDLDIVVNNLRGPAQLYENRLCGGESLAVDLRWHDSMNTHVIGARLAVHTDAGIFYRDVRAASGYLAGDAARVHFGFPAGTKLQLLQITWPDGELSRIEEVRPNTLLQVERDDM